MGSIIAGSGVEVAYGRTRVVRNIVLFFSAAGWAGQLQFSKSSLVMLTKVKDLCEKKKLLAADAEPGR